jgi:hypothetical protein
MNQLRQPEFGRILPIEIGQEIYNGNILTFVVVNGNGGEVGVFGC